MPQIVSHKCGFEETVENLLKKVFKGQERQTEWQETFINQTILEKEICRLENTKLNAMNLANANEITNLNAELVAASNLKVRLEKNIKESQDRFTLFKDFSEKLEFQFNKTLTAKTEKFSETISLKMNEIENLMSDLQIKNEEIKRKDLKIKILEEQNKMLENQNKW